MKRINPITGKYFKRGDLREDGSMFVRYTNRKRRDGTFIEDFVKPERMKTGNKRINPETGKYFKRGDTRKEDDLVFLNYRIKRMDKKGNCYEDWVTKENFIKFEKQKNTLTEKGRKKNKELFEKGVHKKRKNPKTGKFFKIGDEREDGFFFISYETRNKTSGNYVGEIWSSPDSYKKSRISNSLYKIRKKCKLKNIPIDIDLNYLVEIFPDDFKCPISGERMKWGVFDSFKESSPSIDRIVPEKGYVKGNVRWVQIFVIL